MDWQAFLKGMGSIFGVSTYRSPYAGKDPFEADRDALRADYEAIGQDMWKAIEKFEEENAEDLRRAREEIK